MRSDETTEIEAYTAKMQSIGVEYIWNSKYSTVGLGSRLS
jgi:hypothetical protein